MQGSLAASARGALVEHWPGAAAILSARDGERGAAASAPVGCDGLRHEAPGESDAGSHIHLGTRSQASTGDGNRRRKTPGIGAGAAEATGTPRRDQRHPHRGGTEWPALVLFRSLGAARRWLEA